MLRFLVRCPVPVIVTACFVRHDLDTRLNQAVQALLKRRVHVRDCRREPFGVETETVYRHFPVFGEAVFFAFFNVHILEF
jgi:hypothetical protein